MAKNILDNYIYFGQWDKFAVLPSYPDEIRDSMQTQFDSQNALSRSAPVYTYSQSGPRSIAITLELHRDMMDDINKNVSNLKAKLNNDFIDISGDYVDTLIKYLQSCSVPKYSIYANGAKAVEPPWVAIRFGNDIFIKGVINGNVEVTRKKPLILNKDGNLTYACMSVGFTVYETEPFDASEIKNQGSFRGITRSFKKGIFS